MNYIGIASTELPMVTSKELRERLMNFGDNVVDVGFNAQERRQKRRQKVVEYVLVSHILKRTVI